MRSNAEYSAAFKLIEYFFIIPTIYMRANFPHLNKIYKKEKCSKQKLLKHLKGVDFSLLVIFNFYIDFLWRVYSDADF